jgi:hypothetical protein
LERIRIAVAAFLMLVCSVATLAGQTATGVQPLGSVAGGPETINLGNLNIHWAFPVFSRSGRGNSFSYVLTYDNSIFQPLASGSTTAWTPTTNFGWRGQTEIATGYIAEKSTNQTCYLSGTHDLGGFTTRTTYAYHDPFGVTHAFGGWRVVVDNEGAANCPPESDPSYSATANDGSGYSIYQDDTETSVSSKAGQKIHDSIRVGLGGGPTNSIQTFFAAPILGNGKYGPRIPLAVFPGLNATPYQAPWSKIGVYINETSVFVQGTKGGGSLAHCHEGY